jgi:hypothetical protein
VRNERRLRQATRYLRQRGLTDDPETVAVTVRLRSAQMRGVLIAGGVWLAVYVPILMVAHVDSEVLAMIMRAAGSFAITAAFGAVGGALAVGRTAPGSGPRVAHAARPGLEDYLLPAQRWWSPALVVVSGLLALAYVTVPPPDASLGPGAAAGVWALAAAVVGADELVGRWLLRRPQPAGSPGELAVRNEITGDMLGALALYSLPALVIATLGIEYSDLLFALGAALVVVPVGLEFDRRRRVRERLWRVPAT